jgi:hypothetical protein
MPGEPKFTVTYTCSVDDEQYVTKAMTGSVLDFAWARRPGQRPTRWKYGNTIKREVVVNEKRFIKLIHSVRKLKSLKIKTIKDERQTRRELIGWKRMHEKE